MVFWVLGAFREILEGFLKFWRNLGEILGNILKIGKYSLNFPILGNFSRNLREIYRLNWRIGEWKYTDAKKEPPALGLPTAFVGWYTNTNENV